MNKTYEEITIDIDNLMTKIKDKVPQEHDPLKILAFQQIEMGYFWIRKIYEIMAITDSQKTNAQRGML